MKSLLFFFFVVLHIHAQEVLFEGHIYDQKTKETIPYVNLSFLNTLKGTSTDEEGHFFIDIPTSYLEKKVHISSLGFKDTIVDASILFKAKKMYMLEESFELQEVVLTEKLDNTNVLNPISSSSLASGFSSSSTPWVLALYFPNIGAQEKKVNKVTVFFKKNENFKRASSKFRIRIYDVDEVTKKPNRDLLRKSIVLEHNIKQEYVSVDLDALNIEMPREGLYVGIEWLFVPSNWYKHTTLNKTLNKKEIEDRFAPTFSGAYTQNQNYKVMVYGMGAWSDFKVQSKNNTKNLVPAISLKIKTE